MKLRIDFLCEKMARKLSNCINHEIRKEIKEARIQGRREANCVPNNETIQTLRICLISATESFNKIKNKELYQADVIRWQSKIDTLKDLITYFESRVDHEI